MKQGAVVLAATLALTLVAPAFAQPFADVPTDHWAYDAIAELAAKGLIEGYPDGAFRGDRAMTRYEMAMVVARLLARIEAIKIPPLPPDLVRRDELGKAQAAEAAARTALDKRLTSKLATVQRLVAEFRAELAALGVRVTAVEEELAAIRARLDNTRVTGDVRFRYNVFPVGSPSGSGTFRAPDARMRARLTFTGRVAPNVEAVVRLWAANNAETAPNYDTRFGGGLFFNNVSFDALYLDIRNTWGATLWRVGRQTYTNAGYGPLGVGLLFDPANSVGLGSGTAYAPNVASTTGYLDGLRSDWTLGPIGLSVQWYTEQAAGWAPGLMGTPDRQYVLVRGTTSALLPGWTLGGTYYRQGASPYLAPGGFNGGTGWGADISGTLFPGVTLYGDYASWTFRLEPGGIGTFPAATAWRVGGNVNLAQVAGIAQWNPSIDWEYRSYGPLPSGAVAPRYSYATTLFFQRFDWSMQGWMARLNLTFSPRTSAFLLYETGNTLPSPGSGFTEWWVRLTHRLTPTTVGYIQWTRATLGASETANFYRAELSYSW
jgi:hypothetical protein